MIVVDNNISKHTKTLSEKYRREIIEEYTHMYVLCKYHNNNHHTQSIGEGLRTTKSERKSLDAERERGESNIVTEYTKTRRLISLLSIV